ncbi:hypothetical protein Q7P37_001374 [Cladosporium fusiforme]
MELTARPPETPRSLSNEAPDNNNATPIAGAKRKRQPRNSACLTCAGLKMKCVATSVPGTCERCHRMSRECHPSVPKPRKRASTQGLSEPERRALPLSDILDNNVPLYQAPNPFAVFHAGDRASDTPSDLPPAKPDVTQPSSPSFVSLFAHGLGLEEKHHDALDLLSGVDYTFVHDSFVVFERMACRSPFIELPYTDVIKMVAKRPVTCLAICAVATSANTDTRLRLVRAFRHTISAKCIMEGERSIDLMSGLLIHLAWHHRHMANQQINQMMHLLVGMATDQGLFRQFGHNVFSPNQPDRETQLLFLGCYYMCTALAGVGSGTPSPLLWSDHLYDVARRFSSNGPFANESNIVPFIEFGRYLGDVDSTIRGSSESLDIPSRDRSWSVWHSAEAELRRLKALVRQFPIIASHPDVQASRIAISAIVLQNSRHAQTSLLNATAISIKSYFDTILSESTATFTHMSIVDWTHLLSVLAALVLILHPHFETWEAVPGALRSLLEPESVLETIAARLGTTSSYDHREEFFEWFVNLLSRIKSKLQQDRSAVSRGRTGSGDMSETEARFRPVNAAPSYPNDRPRFADPQSPGGGVGVCDVDVGRACKLDLLEDSFWDRLLQS